MMKRLALKCILGLTMGLAAPVFAQISTFPAPPPLAPKSQNTSDWATNSSSASSDNSASGSTDKSEAGASTETTPSPQHTEQANPNDAIPVTAATLSSMNALDDKIPLVPGDRISFRVIEDRDDAVPRMVTDTGEVDFPYTGRLKVAGLTCRQVALQLKRLLEVDYYKRATVIIGLDVIALPPPDTNHPLVWIVGQVRQVGPMEISKDHPLTVSQAILRAGGFGDFADQRKVHLLHRGSHANAPTPGETTNEDNSQAAQIVDVKAVFDGQSSVDPLVEPNDLIVVPKRLINF
jgi:protein involved in polysaccharide export with SLBB domain